MAKPIADILAAMAAIAGELPTREPDPFDIFTHYRPGGILGMDVFESPDVPRYTLPAELIPGVPWPPGFREEINKWSVSFLGTVNTLPRGTAYVVGQRTLVMRPSDLIKITNIIA